MTGDAYTSTRIGDVDIHIDIHIGSLRNAAAGLLTARVFLAG
ncbi:hypothetical protein [Paraburkholderia humisilvae]|nr:hypothetical protein [Paraburkholderia humisilvae]